MKAALLVCALTIFAINPSYADGSLEDRVNQLQKQLDGMKNLQREVDELKAQLALQAQEAKAQQEVQAQPSRALSEAKPDQAGSTATAIGRPTMEDASPTSIGGYGEFTYANVQSDDTPDQADLLRFVVFLGHRFNDNLTFQSELEVEHAVTSSVDAGEVAVEQAAINYQFKDALNVKAGLLLIPLGFLNENHEPPTFYGVFRNNVETRIIPTTWREGGVGVHGRLAGGFNYDVGLTTGFDAGKIDEPSSGIRSAHQELQLANANDGSVYGSLKYVGYPGVLLGVGIFSGNTGQDGDTSPRLKHVDARFTLGEVHARYSGHGFDLQALYSLGTLSDAAQVTEAIRQAAPKRMEGWFLQAAYHLWARGDMDLAPFVRYEEFDIDQKVDLTSGYLRDRTARDNVATLGLSFKPYPEVVVKADYQNYEKNSGFSSFNLGLGYMF